jgi:hypothetical protein
MDVKFIEVRQPGEISAGEVARRAEDTGATLALVMEGNTPVAFIDVYELAPDDDSPIGTHVSDALRLDEASYPVELPEGATFDVVVFYRRDLAVVTSGEEPLVVTSAEPLHGVGDVRLLLASRKLEVLTADTTLPGPVDPPPDPEVTYICEHGHRIPQRLSNRNRRCPFDDTPLSR